MNEQTLLSDFLFNLKKSYKYNVKKYNKRTRWFIAALYSFIIANISFITFVIKNIMGGGDSMPEENKEKNSDRVKPLEVRPGGKEKGTRMVVVSGEVRKDKK